MPVNDSFARRVRVERLYHHCPKHLLVVPLDHPISTGPIVERGRLDRLVGQLADGGADAVVLHKGNVRRIRTRWFHTMSLFVHLSASTALAPDPDGKYLVSTVEEAVRLGADGVSVHVNIGSHTEPRQVADLAAVAEACERWGVPLLAMVYPRGPAIADGRDPTVISRAVAVAAELGADLVKTAHPGSPEAMAQVTRCCPVPVLVAGGPADAGADSALTQLTAAMRGGAAGIAAGRLIFSADDPGAMTRRLAAVVHDPCRCRS